MPNEKTFIRTDQGLIKLKDIKKGSFITKKNGYSIYESLDEINIHILSDNKVSIVPLGYIHIKKNEPQLEVITSSSRNLIFGREEKLLTIDNDLEYSYSKIEVGMTIPRIRSFFIPDSHVIINLPKIDESKYLFKDMLPLDLDLGWFFGVYVGDGWVSGDIVCLASESCHIPNRIKSTINRYILSNKYLHISKVEAPHLFEGKESYCEKHSWSSKRFATLLRENIGSGAYFKKLPFIWVNSPLEFRWGILSGLIDTDGSISYNEETQQVLINYTTVSKILADEVIALSHSLNLTATVTKSKTPKGKPCYIVTFSQESIFHMQEYLILTVPKKRKRLAEFSPKPTFKRNKYTPLLSSFRLTELRNAIGARRVRNRAGNYMTQDEDELVELKKRRSLYQVVYRVERLGSAITKQTALDIIDLKLVLFEESAFWQKWVSLVKNPLIEWDLIKEVNSHKASNLIELLSPNFSPVLLDSGYITGLPMFEDKLRQGLIPQHIN